MPKSDEWFERLEDMIEEAAHEAGKTPVQYIINLFMAKRANLPGPLKNADQLLAEGRRLSAAGNKVPILRPSQEWMAVADQTPFLLPARKKSAMR